jgi:hypothetical protein
MTQRDDREIRYRSDTKILKDVKDTGGQFGPKGRQAWQG